MRLEHTEEVSGVVVAWDDNYGCPSVRQPDEGLKHQSQRCEGGRRPIEQITGYRNEVHLAILSDTHNLIQNCFSLGDPIYPSQFLADVPVGGVQDLQCCT
jgi:hypothetical protein